MTDIDKLIAVERKYLGYTESPPNSNRTIFGEYTGTNGQAWCASYQCKCINEAGLSRYVYGGKKFASCTALMNYHKKLGQVVTSGYRKGDLLLFQFNGDPLPDHIGLCTGRNGDVLMSIEGNTSVGNDANGGEVMERPRKESLVLCAVRPFTSGGQGTSDAKPAYRPDKRLVAGIQAELNELYGFGLSVDGVYGSNTKRALIKAIQSELNRTYGAHLIVDGAWGAKSISAYHTVSIKSSGRLVRLVQMALCIKQEKIDIDSIFGMETMDAAKAFQESRRIKADGSVNKGTITLLLK